MPRRATTAALCVLAALSAGPALADGVLVLTQLKVAQYDQVLAGYREVAPGAAAVDVADAAAVASALARAPDVVVAIGSKAFDLAKAQAGSAAVVAAAVLAPDTDGKPGVTAVPMEPRSADVVATLAALAPKAKRILALYPPAATHAVADASATVKRTGLNVTFRPLPDVSGFQESFRVAIAGHDAVWLVPDVRLAKPEIVKFMVSSCLEQRVALVGFLDGMTRVGALASVSADFPAIGREAARLAAELLAKPKPARVGVPFRFVGGKVSVNERTREALGLTGSPPAGAELFR